MGLDPMSLRICFLSQSTKSMSIGPLNEHEFVARFRQRYQPQIDICFIAQNHKQKDHKNEELLNTKLIYLKKNKWLPSPLASLIYLVKAFCVLFMREKYDIFVADDIVQSAFVIELISKIFRKKSVVTIHGFYEEELARDVQSKLVLYHYLKLPICRIMAKFSMKWADMIVVNDKRLEKQLVMRGVAPKRLFTRYVCADTIKFSKKSIDPEKRHLIKSSYKLPEKYILYVGRLTEWDGLSDFLEGFIRLKKEITEVKCVIVGEGPLEQTVNNYIKDNRFEGEVIRVGEVAHELMPYLYDGAHLVMLPMYPPQAGISRITLEALSMEVPVITTDIGVFYEAVIDGETGYRFPLGDLDSMVSLTISLLKNQRLIARMGKRGRALVKSRFDVDTYIDNWVESIKSLSLY